VCLVCCVAAAVWHVVMAVLKSDKKDCRGLPPALALVCFWGVGGCQVAIGRLLCRSMPWPGSLPSCSPQYLGPCHKRA
jgi:hypothetical protein